MTQLEITDEKTRLTDINEGLYKHATDEGRSMNEDEKATFQKNLRTLEDLNLMGASNKLKGADGKQVTGFENVHIAKKERFSLLKTVREIANGGKMNDVARDINIIGTKEFRASGINPQGTIIIPTFAERANILAGTATAGQEIVAEEKRDIMPPLTDKLVLAKAGATFKTGLVGNISFPSYAGTTVEWKGEIVTAVDGGGAFSEVLFAPKRLTGFINVSKTFLAQDGVGAEQMLLDNIANAVARKLEKTILGPATLHADYPSGIGYKINNASASKKTVLTGATITYAAMVGLESAIDVTNALQGNLAFITNSKGRGLLKTMDKGVSNDTGDYVMSDDNYINGYPVYVTNAIGSDYGSGGDGNLVVFGNWADLMIGQWGGYDITVDPYTAAKTNQVVIVINAYFDAKGLRGANGTAAANLDEYAISFAAESVK